MRKGVIVSGLRRYWHEGKLYVIRDAWRRDWYGRRRLLRCEYAVRNPNGSKKWLPTYEGTLFADIQPLRVRANG